MHVPRTKAFGVKSKQPSKSGFRGSVITEPCSERVLPDLHFLTALTAPLLTERERERERDGDFERETERERERDEFLTFIGAGGMG